MHFGCNFKKIVISIASFILLLTMNACTTNKLKDGPPPYEVDISRIPDAKPKPERLAKYGNMKKYRVFGKNYYVLKTAKNYQENGIASWYGRKFHNQLTSSGEQYNMLLMTAAHKTLPLPTYVQVTNLKNKRSIIVKVNDRGPFASNRIIDLSYVAAKKLGMLGHGTTYVNVKAIDPNIAYKHADMFATVKKQQSVTYPNIPTPLYLQVGAFKNKAYAEKIRNQLSPLTLSPIYISSSPANQLYKVKIGPIKDIATLAEIKKKLQKYGFSPTIKT